MIYFKPLTTKHIKQGWLKWVNTKESRLFIRTVNSKLKYKDLKKWLEKNKKLGDITYAIYLKENNKFIGTTRISLINHVEKSCTLGRLIGENSNRDKGLGSMVTKKVIKLAFNKLKLNKVWVEVYANNKRSLKSHLNGGFFIAGVKKFHYLQNKKFVDTIYLEKVKNRKQKHIINPKILLK